MATAGMVVAIEIDAVIEKYGQPIHTEKCAGVTVMEYKTGYGTLYVAHSGAGEIAAAAATALLIGRFGAEVIINFGVVGGLTPEMALTSTVVVSGVVHYDFDAHEIGWGEQGKYPEFEGVVIPTTPQLVEKAKKILPDLKTVVCASADKFVGDGAAKAALSRSFNAQICDMETAGVVITAARAEVPCLVIKSVSDSVNGGPEEFEKMLESASAACIDVADKILSETLK
jgi:adenosylhomocysteine nucleosidase